jgi:hypothetical protein
MFFKRGQIFSKSIIFLITLMVVAIILLLGYQSIAEVNKKKEDAGFLLFQKNLKDDINSLSGDFGSSRTKDYYLPSGSREICLVDLENVYPEDILNHPLIKDSVQSGVKKNIFLLGEKSFDALYVEDLLLIYPHYSCFTAERKAELVLESFGNDVVIQTPPNQEYCQNAQNGNLCNELDAVLGVGYKSRCCQEHSLCCS